MERQIYNPLRYNLAEKSNSTVINSMGKCVSKQPSLVNLTESDFSAVKGIKRKFSEISECASIYEEDEEGCNNHFEEEKQLKNEGQSESKKNSKRAGPETKGTAMSFGFRKKIHSANKKNANILKEKEKEKNKFTLGKEKQARETSTVIVNSEDFETASNVPISDKNGNEGTESLTEKKEKRGGTGLPPAKRETGSNLPSYKGSRFGFRSSNVVRPASAGLMPKFTDFEENVENNNVTAISTLEKRRSKSATGTQRLQTTDRHQLNDQQQQPPPPAIRSSDTKNVGPKIGTATTTMAATTFNNRNQWFLQQEKHNNMSDMHTTLTAHGRPAGQYTIVNSGMHTNVIVKPTPQPAAVAVSKFTLHTASLPKPQYPVPISLPPSRPTTMDTKNVKQVVNSSRRGFQGPRETSTDSGIASLETNSDYRGRNSPSRSRSRNRPRNLEIVFNSRHKFDVRDLDDALSCDSIEPLSLPKLPSVFSTDNQTVPLNGLVRSIDVASGQEKDETDSRKTSRSHSDAESIEEEKLYRDRSTTEKTIKNPSVKDYNISSKNSSPVSSRSSWCHAGESLAAKDCSSFSLSSSDDSKDNQNEKSTPKNSEDDSLSITISEKPSLLSSLTTTSSTKTDNRKNHQQAERPKTLGNIAETKFAEMAAAVSDILLDDETSPTDSLVSSTESDDALLKKTKNKIKEDIHEKDIDDISPEIDMLSPKSPGTPTHADNSFSLSDVGRDFLIDDEIADQPALLFSDKADLVETNALLNSLTDTPTLIESNSIKSSAQHLKQKLPSLTALDQFNRTTPKTKRRSTLLSRAESLDTLSPCESIASDDLMMDFDASSLDSFGRLSHSIKSVSGSALQDLDDLQLFTELDAKSGELIREWNNILRVHQTSKDSINSQLPARATRLLNRSRIQSQLSVAGSDSPKSNDSLPHKHSRSSFSGRDIGIASSSDDLIFVDKSFRNSMIQDVQYFKKQLTRLRRILQDTETLNPFEQENGQIFASCGYDSTQYGTDDKDQSSLASSIADDPKQELADLRRQVVYLQGQLNDRDRTIRIQKNMIERLEAERSTSSVATSISEKECINSATQTDRVRPLSIGQEGLARSKPEFASYTTTHFPATTATNSASADLSGRRHTVISTTTFSNLNHIIPSCPSRRTSLSLEKLTYKPVKTTLIGEPIKTLSPEKPIENIMTNKEKLSNGHYRNGTTTSTPPQQSVKVIGCKKKDTKFDDFKQDRRTQTITIV